MYVSFSTPRKPAGVDSFIAAWNRTPTQILSVVTASIDASPHPKRRLVLIDSLHPLWTFLNRSDSKVGLTAFLSSLIQHQPPSGGNSPTSNSVVAVYHTDLPFSSPINPYEPTALQLLSYLATTTITTHSIAILLAHKQAHERSLGAPSFGLEERKAGVLIGLKRSTAQAIATTNRGIALEVEHKRKSGRGVREWYFLPARPPRGTRANTGVAFREHVTLLDDHPLFHVQESESGELSEQDLAGLTFELGLTSRQRTDREGVVLPYFDAQQAGPHSGGRILYDMGVEDDFDEEEDEI